MLSLLHILITTYLSYFLLYFSLPGYYMFLILLAYFFCHFINPFLFYFHHILSSSLFRRAQFHRAQLAALAILRAPGKHTFLELFLHAPIFIPQIRPVFVNVLLIMYTVIKLYQTYIFTLHPRFSMNLDA